MGLVQKIVAGGPGRPTRFHTERGERIPARELIRVARAVGAWSRRQISGSRPQEPWWPYPVIPIVERHLTAKSSVLEFGSGGSSVWLAQRAGQVVSVEDNRSWHRHVSEQLEILQLTNATVRFAEGSDYHDLAWAEDARYDLVVVDGSYRWLCVEAALPRLKPGGMIYLDNSDADKDVAFYPAKGMSRVAQSVLESYAASHGNATLTRHVSFISGEIHVGEGMVLKLD